MDSADSGWDRPEARRSEQRHGLYGKGRMHIDCTCRDGACRGSFSCSRMEVLAWGVVAHLGWEHLRQRRGNARTVPACPGQARRHRLPGVRRLHGGDVRFGRCRGGAVRGGLSEVRSARPRFGLRVFGHHRCGVRCLACRSVARASRERTREEGGRPRTWERLEDGGAPGDRACRDSRCPGGRSPYCCIDRLLITVFHPAGSNAALDPMAS